MSKELKQLREWQLSQILSTSYEATNSLRDIWSNMLKDSLSCHTNEIYDVHNDFETEQCKRNILTKSQIQSLSMLFRDKKCQSRSKQIFFKIKEIISGNLISDYDYIKIVFPRSLFDLKKNENYYEDADWVDGQIDKAAQLLGTKKISIDLHGMENSLGPLSREAILEEEEDYLDDFRPESSSGSSTFREIGLQEFQKACTKLVKLILNLNTQYCPKLLFRYIHTLLCQIIKQGRNGGMGEKLIGAAVKKMFSMKDEKNDHVRLKAIEKAENKIRCQVGVSKFGKHNFGEVLVVETNLNIELYLAKSAEIDTDDKFCIAECTLVQYIPISHKELCKHSAQETKQLDSLRPGIETSESTNTINDFFVSVKLISSYHQNGILSEEKNWPNSRKLGDHVQSSKKIISKPIESVVNGDSLARKSTTSFSLDSSYELLGWGDNKFNCLGVESFEESKEEYNHLFPRYISIPSLPPFDHIVSVACSKYHTLISTSLGFVYSCGDGSDGQLGHGTLESRKLFQQIDWFSFRNNGGNKNSIYIQQISAGADDFGSHSAAIDNQGKLYTWGKITCCGHYIFDDDKIEESDSIAHRKREKLGSQIRFPKEVVAFKGNRVLKVSCGGSFTLAIVQAPDSEQIDRPPRQSTSVYSWGLHSNGRLGHRNVKVADSKKIHYNEPRKIVPLYQLNPRRIKILDNKQIKEVSAGKSHALAVSSEGELFAWGDNSHGQCGLVAIDLYETEIAASQRRDARMVGEKIPKSPSAFDDVWLPRVLPPFKRYPKHLTNSLYNIRNKFIKSERVEAGFYHSAAIDSKGDLWTWGGAGRFTACLGHGDVQFMDGINKDFSLDSNFLCKLSGNLSPPKWGMPRVVEALKDKDIKEINFGEAHSICLTKRGSFYIWGNGCSIPKNTTQYENNDEQIGKNNNQLNTLFPKEPNSEWIQHLEGLHISKVACAGQHTFVISNGTKISHKIGHSLLRECKLYSKHLKDVTESNQGNEQLPSVSKDIARLIQPDCCIIVSGKRIYCHTFILAQRCSVLRDMIADEERPLPQSEMSDGCSMLELLLPHIRVEVGMALIRYLYTDQLLGGSYNECKSDVDGSYVSKRWVPSFAFLQDLYKVAKEFLLGRLMHLCKQVLNYFESTYEASIKTSKIGQDQPMIQIEGTKNKEVASLCLDYGTSLLRRKTLSSYESVNHIKLIASDKIIQIRPCILIMRSLFFRNLLSSTVARDSGNDISKNMRLSSSTFHVPCSFPALVRLVYYLHTGIISNPVTNPTNVEEPWNLDHDDNEGAKKKELEPQKNLLKCHFLELEEDLRNAHLFQVFDMKSECESRVEITAENVERVLKVSKDINSPYLKEKVLYFLSNKLCDKNVYNKLQQLSKRNNTLMSDLFERIKNSETNRYRRGGISFLMKTYPGGYGYDLRIPREIQRDWKEVEERKREHEKEKRARAMKDIMGTFWFDFYFELDHEALEKCKKNNESSILIGWIWTKSFIKSILKTSGGKAILAIFSYSMIQGRVKLGAWVPITNAIFILVFGRAMLFGL